MSMLIPLEEKDKQHWRDFVKPLVHVYNCTRNDTKGYSSAPILPLRLIRHIRNTCRTCANVSMRATLAAENSKKAGERNKLCFDAKFRAVELVQGDRVLVRNVSVRRKHKLADRWERPVHVVVRRIDGGSVYVVKPEKGSGLHRTLHRDLLLPCRFLPVEETPEQGPRFSKARKMDLRSSKVKNQQAECDDSERDLTDEQEVGCVFEGPPQITSWGPFITS